MIIEFQNEQLDATKHQLEALANIFFKDSKLPGSFNIDVFVQNWKQFRTLNIGVIFGYYEEAKLMGAIGGLIHPDVNDGALVAQELFWFVSPKAKIKGALFLYEAFEKWANNKKAVRLNMACVCNKHMKSVRKFYERRGFTPVDISYFKEL